MLSARGEREDVERELEQLTAIERTWVAETDGDPPRGEAPSEDERRQAEMLRQQKKILANSNSGCVDGTARLQAGVAGALLAAPGSSLPRST